MVPAEARGKLEPAEIFHEILVHRWYLSERAGHEVGIFETARDYIDNVLTSKPDELVTADEADEAPAYCPRRTRTRRCSSHRGHRSRSRPITIRWIWLVPSKIWVTLASRNSRSTGYSRV